MRIEDLSNPELVTIAVALLGGELNYVDREDVAIKVHELAPGRFSWRKYPERIDLDAVGTALRHAKKPRKGALLTGNNSTGWLLTPAGLKWIATLDLLSIQRAESDGYRKSSLSAARKMECARLRSTRAYQLFISGDRESITLQDFYQFARVNEYFQAKLRERRFAIVENVVASDPELAELWEYLKERFQEELP